MNTEIFDLGKIGITLGGEYDNKVVYEKLTIVLYKGKSYISTKITHGVSPDQNILVWQLVAEAKDAYDMLVAEGKTTLTKEEFLEQLVDATKGRYVIQGNLVNAADEEDLTVEHSDLLGIDTLKLANRDNTNGMGYVILRKNKSFAEQVTKENTIYEIRYDFTLTEDVTIPANCVLQFEGGSINGAYTITGNKTKINTNNNNIFAANILIEGTWNCPYITADWFVNATNTNVLKQVINLSDEDIYNEILIPKKSVPYSVAVSEAFHPYYYEKEDYDLILNLKSNTKLILEGDIQLETNELPQYEILAAVLVNNIEICGGGKVIGDSDTHVYTNPPDPNHPEEFLSHEWCHGIVIWNCNNITIKDITVEKVIGDAFSIGSLANSKTYKGIGCNKVIIENVKIYTAGRDGITVSSVDNLKISNVDIDNVLRIPEYVGIAMEPELRTRVNTNILYENIRISNCKKAINFWNHYEVSDNRRYRNVTIRNISIVDSPVSDGAGVTLYGCENASLSDIYMKDNGFIYAFNVTGGKNIFISNIIISQENIDIKRNFITCNYGDNVVIKNCDINVKGTFISTNSAVKKILIENNTIVASVFVASGEPRAIIRNNVINVTSTLSIEPEDNKTVLQNNTITVTTGSNYCYNLNNGTIVDNILLGNYTGSTTNRKLLLIKGNTILKNNTIDCLSVESGKYDVAVDITGLDCTIIDNKIIGTVPPRGTRGSAYWYKNNTANHVSGNWNVNGIYKHYGSTSERPDLHPRIYNDEDKLNFPDNDVARGFLYYDRSINKLLVWAYDEWLDVNTGSIPA